VEQGAIQKCGLANLASIAICIGLDPERANLHTCAFMSFEEKPDSPGIIDDLLEARIPSYSCFNYNLRS
jgi:hypothetical protein